MYRTGPRYYSKGPKASTSTQCQRCLEHGHWTYECKKDRSYKVRPTRTQQLKKPIKLAQPELPKEFQDKRGLADKLLKERKRKRRRSRSSSSSSDSDSGSESDSSVSSSSSGSITSSSSSSGSGSSSSSSGSSSSSSGSDSESYSSDSEDRKKKRNTKRSRH
ncbi:zinc knuckle-domain-containing protein [Gilbertella persicaria]|uniref:zinc knuckle-domain-containing protein n=1 Tax=Gilbertella persicaria TaxID=101096 RepID=UPI00221E6939|nr:zinc knuckle-domain-containing protein [Gilbertella persicaria]KAI8094953.1 zinc knuckle-domain-containing protein [Gilbertella persicaria]